MKISKILEEKFSHHFETVFFGLLIASIIYWIIGSTGKDAQDTNIFTFLEYILEIATK
ncbi:hypothetical protein ONA23_02035 [Mycoplasmopsis cynos]|uniref:hypothetical protein n=1 Tax=Mycoplasmopsis cynos TaxID=171284 RepID=UPI0024CDF08A|nr:hypothetical protein [Mycoplasmopsis cynos]WAM06964.1 hypothetical protein ONA23_02035 [Mycoplasmopsis cynos]